MVSNGGWAVLAFPKGNRLEAGPLESLEPTGCDSTVNGQGNNMSQTTPNRGVGGTRALAHSINK